MPLTLSDVTFSDPSYSVPGPPVSFSASINWGDGNTTTGNLVVVPGQAGTPTTGTVSGTHLFRPNTTSVVTVTVTDSDGKSASKSFQVTTGTPTVTLSAGADRAVQVGSFLNLANISFSDSAAGQTHTATINWGDQTGDQIVPASALSEPSATSDLGSIGGRHAYGLPGNYTATTRTRSTRRRWAAPSAAR